MLHPEVSLQSLMVIAQSTRWLSFKPQQAQPKGLLGRHLSPIKGSGMELAHLRPYQTGDDLAQVDWRASARTRHLLTRQFQTEKQLRMDYALDLSPSMHWASAGLTKAERALQLLAALLGWSGRLGDRLSMRFYDGRDWQPVVTQGLSGQQRLIYVLHQARQACEAAAQRAKKQAYGAKTQASDDAMLAAWWAQTAGMGGRFLFTDLGQAGEMSDAPQKGVIKGQSWMVALGDAFEWGEWPLNEGLVVTDERRELALSAAELTQLLAEQAAWAQAQSLHWQALGREAMASVFCWNSHLPWAHLLQSLVPALLARGGSRG